MIVPPVLNPVELWEPSAVLLWQGDRLLQLAHHPARGGVDKKGGNGAPSKCGWEDVVFEPSRDTGCALMSVSLALHLVRRSSVLGWFRTQGDECFSLGEGDPDLLGLHFDRFPAVACG